MPYNTSFIANPATLESRKFIQVGDTTRFPVLSVMITSYDESYPPNTSTLGSAVTAINTYNSYAILTKEVGGSTAWDTVSAAINDWVAFPSNPATSVTIRNDSGSTIFLRRAGTTSGYGGVPLVNNQGITITLSANTAEVQGRCASAVTMHGIYYA